MNENPDTGTSRARNLRRNETDPEYRLWYELRARRLNGYKFVRQFPIGSYIADFACRTHWLIIELDGSQHAESTRDAYRTKWLNGHGYSVLRFWNEEVLRERDAVLETILAVVEGRVTELSNASCPSSGLRFALATFSPQGRRMGPRSAPFHDEASSTLQGEGRGSGMRGCS